MRLRKFFVVFLTVIAGSVSLPGNSDSSLLALPKVIYAAVGVEMNVYFENVVLRSFRYRIEVECAVGEVLTDRWSYIPALSEEGLYGFTMKVFDESDELLVRSESILRVTGPSPEETPLKIMFIGDSLTDGGRYLNVLATHLSNASIANEMLGTVTQRGVSYVAYGGYSWNRYLNAPDGSFSPFVVHDVGLDIERFFDEQLIGEIPDLIVFFLGINDMFGLSRRSDEEIEAGFLNTMEYANNLVVAFREVVPDTDIAICLIPPSSNKQSVFNARYGLNKFFEFKWRETQQNLNVLYVDGFEERELESFFVIPLNINIDRNNAYSNTDPIHPNNFGNDQIADSLFSWFVSYLQRESYEGWTISNFSSGQFAQGQAQRHIDFDRDNIANSLEFQLFLNPRGFDANPLKINREGLSWIQREGSAIKLLYSENLVDWNHVRSGLSIDFHDGFAEGKLGFNETSGDTIFWRLDSSIE